MIVQLVQQEISVALIEYMQRIGVIDGDRNITINYTAGRKGTGICAELNINVLDAQCVESTFTEDAPNTVQWPVAEPAEPAEQLVPEESEAAVTTAVDSVLPVNPFA